MKPAEGSATKPANAAANPSPDPEPAHRPRSSSPVALLLLPLLAGLLLRLAFVLWLDRVPNDTLLYAEIAHNWFARGVYGFTTTVAGHPGPPRPTLIRLPGYPLLLGLCGVLFGWAKIKAVLLVQTALDLWTCTLVAGTSARLFGERTRTPALWLGALCPFLANYAAVPLTETPTVFTVALAFYALVRWQAAGAGIDRWIAVLAVALAWSIQLRPEQGLLAAAIVPAMLWIAWQRQGGRLTLAALTPAVLVSLLTLLPLVPWTIRNERTFHVFQPLAPRSATDPGGAVPLGFERWFRTFGLDYVSTETAYWPYDNDDILITDLPSRAFDSPAQRAETEAILDDYNRFTTATPALDARFDALARERIAASPMRYYVLLPLARALNMCFRPSTSFLPLPTVWWRLRPQPWRSVLAGALAVLNLAYFAAAAWGWRKRRELAFNRSTASPILWSMLAMIALRFALLLTIDNSEPRYTLEFYPILIVLAVAVL